MGKRKRTAKPRKTVPVNADLWSEASRRSVVYGMAPAHYEDIEYRCWHCGDVAVFSAEEQKRAFEVRGAYVWQRRVLCTPCKLDSEMLKRELQAHQLRWRSDRPVASLDRAFLERYLWLHRELPKYGSRTDTAAISMLGRHIANVAGREASSTASGALENTLSTLPLQ
jgi:hypothetical protein